MQTPPPDAKRIMPPSEVDWIARAGTPGGFQAYSFTLEGRGRWQGVRMLLGPPEGDDEGGRWRCYLMIGSELLWRERGEGRDAYAVAHAVLHDLDVIAERPAEKTVKPARVDLCCDHWGEGLEWTIADLRRFACRNPGWSRGQADSSEVAPEPIATPEGWTWGSADGPTLYIGRRGSGARFLRIYAKTAEAAKSGKLPWLEPIWARYGWRRGMKVWRLEVEFGGAWVRDHGLKSLADMQGCERALWRDYLEDVRHVASDTAQQLRHARPSHLWHRLRNAPSCMHEERWHWQPRDVDTTVDQVHLWRQAAGCFDRAVRESLRLQKDRVAKLRAEERGPGDVVPTQQQADERGVRELMRHVEAKREAEWHGLSSTELHELTRRLAEAARRQGLSPLAYIRELGKREARSAAQVEQAMERWLQAQLKVGERAGAGHPPPS